jgi:phosphopantetheine--protein transferase-like protein
LLESELIKVRPNLYSIQNLVDAYLFVELINSVPSWNLTFLARNFTDAEVAYCRSQPSAPASFAARWVGKEAVFKSLGVASKGAAAPMRDIEILPGDSGAPEVTLYGDAKVKAEEKGVTKVLISLSHSEVRFECFFCASLLILPYRLSRLHLRKPLALRKNFTRLH